VGVSTSNPVTLSREDVVAVFYPMGETEDGVDVGVEDCGDVEGEEEEVGEEGNLTRFLVLGMRREDEERRRSNE